MSVSLVIAYVSPKITHVFYTIALNNQVCILKDMFHFRLNNDHQYSNHSVFLKNRLNDHWIVSYIDKTEDDWKVIERRISISTGRLHFTLCNKPNF